MSSFHSFRAWGRRGKRRRENDVFFFFRLRKILRFLAPVRICLRRRVWNAICDGYNVSTCYILVDEPTIILLSYLPTLFAATACANVVNTGRYRRRRGHSDHRLPRSPGAQHSASQETFAWTTDGWDGPLSGAPWYDTGRCARKRGGVPSAVVGCGRSRPFRCRRRRRERRVGRQWPDLAGGHRRGGVVLDGI